MCFIALQVDYKVAAVHPDKLATTGNSQVNLVQKLDHEQTLPDVFLTALDKALMLVMLRMAESTKEEDPLGVEMNFSIMQFL